MMCYGLYYTIKRGGMGYITCGIPVIWIYYIYMYVYLEGYKSRVYNNNKSVSHALTTYCYNNRERLTCLVRLLCVQETPARKKQKLGLESRCLDTWRERERPGAEGGGGFRTKMEGRRELINTNKVEWTSKILSIEIIGWI